MKRWWLLGIFGLLVALHGSAQQVIYANLKELVEDRGDTLSTLKIEKRSKNQILLMGVRCAREVMNLVLKEKDKKSFP